MSLPKKYGLKEYKVLAGLWIDTDLSKNVTRELVRVIRQSAKKSQGFEDDIIHIKEVLNKLKSIVKKFSNDYIEIENQEHFKRDSASGQELKSLKQTVEKMLKFFNTMNPSKAKLKKRTIRALNDTSRRRGFPKLLQSAEITLLNLQTVIQSTIKDERLVFIKKENRSKKIADKKEAYRRLISRLIQLWKEVFNEYPEFGTLKEDNNTQHHLDTSKPFNTFIVNMFDTSIFNGLDIVTGGETGMGNMLGLLRRELKKVKTKTDAISVDFDV